MVLSPPPPCLPFSTSSSLSAYLPVTSVDPDPTSELKALVSLRLLSDLPPDRAASGLEVEVPLPRHVQRAHCDLDARLPPGQQSWEFGERGVARALTWRFKRLQGGVDCALRARLTLERPYGASLRSEVCDLGVFLCVCGGGNNLRDSLRRRMMPLPPISYTTLHINTPR